MCLLPLLLEAEQHNTFETWRARLAVTTSCTERAPTWAVPASQILPWDRRRKEVWSSQQCLRDTACLPQDRSTRPGHFPSPLQQLLHQYIWDQQKPLCLFAAQINSPKGSTAREQQPRRCYTAEWRQESEKWLPMRLLCSYTVVSIDLARACFPTGHNCPRPDQDHVIHCCVSRALKKWTVQPKWKGDTPATICSIHPDQSFKRESRFSSQFSTGSSHFYTSRLCPTGQQALLFP